MRVVWCALLLGLSACGADTAPETASAPPTPPEVAPVALAEMLPDSVLGRARQSLDQSRDGALGAEIERAQAQYREIDVSITDFKTAEMTGMMGYGWALAPDAERVAGHPGVLDTAAHSASVQIVVGERYLIEATAASEEDAMAAIQALDLPELD